MFCECVQAHQNVCFVNVFKHTKMYLTPLPPTGSGPNRSKAHKCPGFDGTWLLLSTVKLLVGCFTCWHVSPGNNFPYLPSCIFNEKCISQLSLAAWPSKAWTKV